MKRLLDIVSFFKEYILLACCLLVSVILLATNDTQQIRTIRSLTVAVIGFFEDTMGFIPDYFNLRQENRVLREMNLVLSEQLSRLREAESQNARLRKLLDLKGQTQYSYVSANVVGKSLQPMRNSITIDIGESNGVRVNMPIVTDEGLVGKVVATSRGYAVGQTLFHADLRTSATVRRGRVDGILASEGGISLSLRNVAKTLDVQLGDTVITSEYSSLFPRGIVIGVVSKTVETPGDLFQTIEVTPSADLYRLEEVFVITHTPDTSRIALEQRVRG